MFWRRQVCQAVSRHPCRGMLIDSCRRGRSATSSHTSPGLTLLWFRVFSAALPKKRISGTLAADDALNLFPPTRTYSNAEVQQGLTANGIDGVLVINVGDTGVQQQYAGTILSGQYQGSSNASGTVNTFGNASTVSMSGTSSGTMTATATPIYRYRRQTNFNARLFEASTGRHLWVGNGQVNAGGLLFVGEGASSSSSVAAIFEDLQAKGIIGPSS